MMTDLRLGDCLKILPTLEDKSVDAIITDLPYGTTACKWDVIIPLDAMWEQVKRICKGAFVTTASQPFTSVLVDSNLKWFRHETIWNKILRPNNFLRCHKEPMKLHENILVFCETDTIYNPQKIAGEPYIRKNKTAPKLIAGAKSGALPIVMGAVSDGLRYPKSIIEYYRDGNKDHPTQKPVALYEYLIKTYTNPGDTVLDFCMGSGTTGVACVKTGRNFIGIEKERNYFTIAQKRIKKEQQQMIMELS